MKENTCCFVGERKLPKEKIERIVKALDREINNLIAQGVTEFISGGALGFDQIATSLIVAKKEMGADVRLIFALPYRNHEAQWNAKQRELHDNLLAEANELVYVSEEDGVGCAQKHDRYMVDRTGCMICAHLQSTRRMDALLKYAKRKGLRIINIVG